MREVACAEKVKAFQQSVLLQIRHAKLAGSCAGEPAVYVQVSENVHAWPEIELILKRLLKESNSCNFWGDSLIQFLNCCSALHICFLKAVFYKNYVFKFHFFPFPFHLVSQTSRQFPFLLNLLFLFCHGLEQVQLCCRLPVPTESHALSGC